MRIDLKHNKEYFSASQLKKLFISIGQFQAYLKKQFEESSAMELGSVIHTRILEPEEYNKRYLVLDDTAICEEIGGARPTSTKKYKEWKEELEAEARAKGKKIISPASDHIANKVWRDMDKAGIIEMYFSDGEAEVTITGDVTVADEHGEESTFPALAIVDYDQPDFSVDLKTTSKDISKFKFDANSLGYDIQARLTHGINGKPFVFVVVQTVAPYDIAVFTTSQYFMDRGESKIATAIDNYLHYEDESSTQIIVGEL